MSSDQNEKTGFRTEERRKEKQRHVPQTAWLRGSSSRNEIGAFDFRHTELKTW